MVARFVVDVCTDGAAFSDECGGDLYSELSRIMRDISVKIDDGVVIGVVFDVNGNRVGRFDFREDDE